ncbi:MAG: cation:proton antiporter [Candidatus Latescibacter sp.]|nr:cation:proton antiporter [Candidatus Latescibacter sp.]
MMHYAETFWPMFFMLVLMFSGFLCLYRIGKGPSAPDKMMAIDILGTLMVGFCAILTWTTGKDFYMNIGITWALLSFIGTIALAKYLEGRHFDD